MSKSTGKVPDRHIKKQGLPLGAAEKLANWDPYDQNESSDFFDSEWMFGIKDGFDVVIGNPPYILIQNIPNLSETTRKKYNNFKCAQYKVDLYHLFIEQGIKLLADHGTISYITPNTFIKNKHNNLLREIIHKRCTIRSTVLFYSQVFESVSVDNLIFVYSKGKIAVLSKVFEIRNSISDITTPNRIFKQNQIESPGYVFNFDIDDEKKVVLNKIESKSEALKSFGRAYFGIQTYDRAQYVSKTSMNEHWKPVIDGGNVFAYRIKEGNDYVCFEPNAIKSGGNPDVYKRSRIVVRQIGKFPEGAFCPPGLLTLNTIYNIFLTNSKIDLYFLLAQINSPITRYHWLATNSDNKETFPKIKKAPLESIPIMVSKIHESQISPIVQLVAFTETEKRTALIEVINALVFDLFFQDHMQERGIDVLAIVRKDMAEVTHGKEFDKLSDAEKEQIARQLYSKWTHPNSEVRNRIKLFAVRSPEILRPILES